jgi:hypothetical protein
MINIRNTPKKFDKTKIKRAVTFYLETLLGKKMSANVSVFICFSDLKKTEKNMGNCTWEDDNVRPREFMINIDQTMGLRYTLLTLAHECVHVKQFVRGEMKDRLKKSECGFTTFWKDECVASKELDYWDQPWEIEAHGREKGLYYKFIEHEHKNQK